jgi:uncharacterized protein (TIGR01370 family)
MNNSKILILLSFLLVQSLPAMEMIRFNHTNRLDSLKKIKSYACYYGPDKIKEMSQFDAVIFEPKQHSKKEIEKLKKSGTLTIGYITIGEDDEFHKNAGWYFDRNKDGKPDKNGTWNSWYADARSKEWRDYVVNKKAHAVLVDKGCDGIFLDTVDTAQLYGESHNGMIQLIKELRKTYPKSIIIQNRGFAVIKDTAEYVDGLMYEAFSVHFNFKTKKYNKVSAGDLKWSKQMAQNTLAPLMRKTGLVVLSLDYAGPEQKKLIQFAYNRARYYGFVPYVSTILLDNLFIRKVEKQKYNGIDLNKKNLIPKNPSNGNLCRLTNISVKVDSLFHGYSQEALTDGYRQEKELEWFERSWASAELPGEHFVEITFPATQTVSRIVIYWSIEGDKAMASQVINVFADSRDDFITKIIPEQSEAGTALPKVETKFRLPVKAKKIILMQPASKGPVSKENIMWISEIEIYSK